MHIKIKSRKMNIFSQYRYMNSLIREQKKKERERGVPDIGFWRWIRIMIEIHVK